MNGDEWIENSPTEKDVRILVNELDMSCQRAFAAQKANSILSCIKRSVTSRLKGGCHCETLPGILHVVLGPPVQGRHGPIGMASVEGGENCPRSGTLL